MFNLGRQKSITQNKAISKAIVPELLYLPLSQHIGQICQPQVKAGDEVSLGQCIASVSAQVTSPVHSSVSGKIIAIEVQPHPLLGRCQTIVIENNGLDSCSLPFALRPPQEIKQLIPEQIRNIVFAAGIVGMGGAAFPTHIKLNPPKPVDTLIINCAECEPYLTGDYRLMVEKTREIMQGIELIQKCLRVQAVYIAIEDNKPEAIKVFNHGLRPTSCELKVLKSAYPQGGEKQLIKNILGKEVPSGKLPFEVGVVVQNAATAYAIYEAVYLNKPLYERVVTVTGSCLSNPQNLLARLGTPIKYLIQSCGPFKKEPAKIIVGGPMMGIAQLSCEVPVIKSTTGIVVMSAEEARMQEEEYCIRCGACVRACPAGLLPCLIDLASRKEFWAETKAYNALDCIECGLCNYVCPAKRKLTQAIKKAKLELAR